MKFTLAFCILVLVVAVVTAKPVEDNWSTECEKKAAQARLESKRCEDYQCVWHGDTLMIDGIRCTIHVHSETFGHVPDAKLEYDDPTVANQKE